MARNRGGSPDRPAPTIRDLQDAAGWLESHGRSDRPSTAQILGRGGLGGASAEALDALWAEYHHQRDAAVPG